MELFRESDGSTITAIKEGENFDSIIKRSITTWCMYGGGRYSFQGKATGSAYCSVGPYIFESHTLQGELHEYFKNSDITSDDWLESYMKLQHEIDDRYELDFSPYEDTDRKPAFITFEYAGKCSHEEWEQLMHDLNENHDSEHYFLTNGGYIGGVVDVDRIKHLSYEDFNNYLREHYEAQLKTFEVLGEKASKQREERLLPKLYDGIIHYLEISGKSVDNLQGEDIRHLLDAYSEDGGRAFRWNYVGNPWHEVHYLLPESIEMLKEEMARRSSKKYSISEIADGIHPRHGEMADVLAETADELASNRDEDSRDDR